MPQLTIQQAMELALQHHQAGRLDAAESIYRQVLAAQPHHADALHLLGAVYWKRGQFQVAEQFIRQAIQINPGSGPFLGNLGLVLLEQNRVDEAITVLNKAIELSPDLADAYFNRGAARARLNQLAEAIEDYQRALQLNPHYTDALNNLANALLLQGKADESIAFFQRGLTVNPNDAALLSNLATALAQTGRLDQAVEASRRALAIDPNLAEAANHLGNAYRDLGQTELAIRAYRDALRANPSHAAIHSNLIYALHFDPSATNATIAQELALWRNQHAAGIEPMARANDYSRDPDRPLRIGYVSPDFRKHCQSFFTLPLLANHDATRFEVYCYADVPNPDATTERLKKYTRGWRSIVGLSDRAVAQLVHHDRIDILVDLTLHMSRNRIGVFIYKPAPIQVTWLGYPSSTGLLTMDYRITDKHLDPPGANDMYYTERSVYLPDSFWCYWPPEADLDDEKSRIGKEQSRHDSDSPSSIPRPTTFGCLNSFAKINPAVLSLWAKVLTKVPDSKLLILANTGSHRDRTLRELAALGVDPARVEFADQRPRSEYLDLFNRVDISLDTFPANGHTTTMDSLWMGVPVVTLPGPTAISRGAMSILHTIGHPELVAHSEDQYIDIACGLASDPNRLALLHSTLRQQMRASPLMDAPRFARNMEAVFRRIWQHSA